MSRAWLKNDPWQGRSFGSETNSFDSKNNDAAYPFITIVGNSSFLKLRPVEYLFRLE